jgi:hypothetical protein
MGVSSEAANISLKKTGRKEKTDLAQSMLNKPVFNDILGGNILELPHLP